METGIRLAAAAIMFGLLLPAGIGSPEPFGFEPAVACSFMSGKGLRERGGYRKSGSGHQCRTQRRNLIGGGEVNNTIRYVAFGDAQSVTRLELELQVISRTAVQRAHRAWAEHAALLTRSALHTGLPGEIESAILSAVDGQWTVAGRPVTLQRRARPGTVYELSYRIE